MQLPVIGSVYSMVKTMKLEMRWQQRKDNPYLAKGMTQNSELENLKQQAAGVRKSNAISSIDAKLKSGMPISSDELEYLRINAPELYEKAVEIQKEREEYRKELEKCRSKEEVSELNITKLQNLTVEASSIKNNPNLPSAKKQACLEQILRRIMAINNEHSSFVKTIKYASLPQRTDELKRKKEEIKHKEEKNADALEKEANKSRTAEKKVTIEKTAIDKKTDAASANDNQAEYKNSATFSNDMNSVKQKYITDEKRQKSKRPKISIKA